MNLVMRGILPDNIVTRNGDTLEDDWPYFDENDPIGTYDPLYVDAVVSNPPYSQAWNPTDKETDPRYARFGLAPKGKADYAFLLHDLFHLKSDGRVKGKYYNMTEETRKRKRNKIDTLTELKTEARFNIWQLGKWGYSVEKEASADDIGSAELEWSDIYSFESFRIFEKGKCIFKGCGYVELRNFTKLVKRYKHSHGVKNLHIYTDEILAQI